VLNLNPVYCPKCKLGFSPATVSCPSCGVELVAEEELAGADDNIEPEIDVSDLILLRTDQVDWIRNLVDRLAETEIRFRVLSYNVGGTVSVYVRNEDFERARRVDHEIYELEVHGTEEIRYTKDLQFGSCPACGAALYEVDQECKSCGLIMSGRGWRGVNCQGNLEGDEEVCPHCGEDVNWDEA
jgi:RNA polymerase subunit RPABC4/transcription elongation factor Spt4